VTDLLVTGTDNGVGKTVVAAALVLAMRERGIAVLGFKPVESGVSDHQAPDSAVLRTASGVDSPLARPLLQLAEPLAPALAAERAGRALDVKALELRLTSLSAAGFSVVVEGAGGLLVPLAWGYTALDLAARCGLQAVVVGRPGLGTLNHCALTVGALHARGVTVRGVVLNRPSDPPDLAESTNPSALAQLFPGVPVLVLPRHPTEDPLEAARRSVPFLIGLLG
jgi:dethiobiotin synthetase